MGRRYPTDASVFPNVKRAAAICGSPLHHAWRRMARRGNTTGTRFTSSWHARDRELGETVLSSSQPSASSVYIVVWCAALQSHKILTFGRNLRSTKR